MRSDRLGALLLLALGILTIGMGGHFIFLRPPMLPEDARFTGVDPALVRPEMWRWLGIVFRTWGAFIAGFGVLLVAVAGYLLTLSPKVLVWGVTFAVLEAFGQFLRSNLSLHSDYLWFVAALFALAVLTATGLVLNAHRTPNRGRGAGTGS